jgi:phenylacetate-CoA ligase
MFLPELETMAPGDLVKLQSERLARTVERLKRSGYPFWREKLSGVGEVRSLDDLASLPFTEKSEFRQAYPFGMLAVPPEEVVRVHASSGTSGKPTIVSYTAADVRIFAEVNARSLACAGGNADDVIHIAYGYGLFTGGLGLHYGAEALGAMTVPASGGNPGFQVGLLADLGATGLACTPSFGMLLAERAAEAGLKSRIRLRWGMHGAEPWSEGFRLKLEEAWGEGYDACDIYGLSEVIGPGVAAECRENKGGLHVFEDHFLPEVVDPETGDPLPDGRPGELVLTTITRQAQPVIRYRTRDLTRMLPGECPCGRTARRIGRLEGRVDDMLVIRGINVYPREIETVLLADPAVGSQYAIIVDRRNVMAELEVRAELADEAFLPSRAEVAARLAERLASQLRVRISVDVRDPGAIPRTEVGKARRVFERTTDADPLP